jgi:hypothetical protein
VVRVLLGRLIAHVPTAAHGQALSVRARTRVTTESLLAEIMGPSDAPSLFDWLRRLSCIEQGVEGIIRMTWLARSWTPISAGATRRASATCMSDCSGPTCADCKRRGARAATRLL